MGCFPSPEGIKRVCDGEKRGVGWAEVFLLLFGEVLSVRFWVTALGLGSYART